MKESHVEQLFILVGFIFILILAIFVPVIVSTLRKNKQKNTVAELKTPDEDRSELALVPEVQIQPTHLETDSKILPAVTIAAALTRTEQNFWGRLKTVFGTGKDQSAALEEIEEILYTSDLGPVLVESLLAQLKSELSKKELSHPEMIRDLLRLEFSKILAPLHDRQINFTSVEQILDKNKTGPTVIMIAGVNGAGKTTSIGKIAAQLAKKNFRVLVAAGDTFRAAAGGQLKTWTDRAQGASSSAGYVEIFWPDRVSDPSAIAYDSIQKAISQKFDFVVLDTAGRLHTQGNLMEELKKVKRVMGKVIPEAPHETWIVLDGNAGQNAVQQACEFQKAIELTGIIMTKLDGTAKGGALMSVVQKLEIPIRLIGIGEQIDDLRVFKWSEYLDGIIGKKL